MSLRKWREVTIWRIIMFWLVRWFGSHLEIRLKGLMVISLLLSILRFFLISWLRIKKWSLKPIWPKESERPILNGLLLLLYFIAIISGLLFQRSFLFLKRNPVVLRKISFFINKRNFARNVSTFWTLKQVHL